LAEPIGPQFAASVKKAGGGHTMWLNLHGLDAENKILEIDFRNFGTIEDAVKRAQGFLLGNARITLVEILSEPYRPFNVLNGPRFPGALTREVRR